MILPIIAYGDPVLKKKAVEINKAYPDLDMLIENMFETMYNASGVGLAAPQIGLSIRLFIVDARGFIEDEEFKDQETELKDFVRVFINPQIIEEKGKEWKFREGCLSIPDVREDVSRRQKITISYFDKDWNEKEETFAGIAARVIQHEYDHVDGILFTDKLSAFKKRLIKGKLNDIAKGNTDVPYRMKYAKK